MRVKISGLPGAPERLKPRHMTLTVGSEGILASVDGIEELTGPEIEWLANLVRPVAATVSRMVGREIVVGTPRMICRKNADQPPNTSSTDVGTPRS